MIRRGSTKIGIFAFLLFFIANTIADKITGYMGRWGGGYNPPISWSEYFERLPVLLFFSLIIGAVVLWIFRNLEVYEEKRTKEANKTNVEEFENDKNNLIR